MQFVERLAIDQLYLRPENRVMKIFKFGGASIKDADSIKNIANILKPFAGQEIVLIASASGKMTNALEAVTNAFFNKTGEAEAKLSVVKQHHYQIIEKLFTDKKEVSADLNDTFVEIEWLLEEEPEESYDYIYDQIVSIGEFLSTKILGAYLNSVGLSTTWMDVRDVILTDNRYREALVDWQVTEKQMNDKIPPLVQKGFVITQGFIGGTSENFTTTLGREGSDYTAAIFSTCLTAKSMTVWKDVPGILTADPRLFKEVIKLDRLSYQEAIEMTYYGAKVIHPKTIKPLQNKQIPLHVKSFKAPQDAGTVISDLGLPEYPPVIVVETQQLLLHISTKDFSFVAEHHLSQLFKWFAEFRLKVNMMRNTAISFSVCITDKPKKVEQLIAVLADDFNVVQDQNLELITIRHFNQETVEELKKGKMVLHEERLKGTLQMVVKNIPSIKRIQ